MENQMDGFIKNTSHVKSSRVKGIIAGFLLIFFFQIEILLWFNSFSYFGKKQRCSCEPFTTVKVMMNLHVGLGFTYSTWPNLETRLSSLILTIFLRFNFSCTYAFLFSYFNVHINFLKILWKRRFRSICLGVCIVASSPRRGCYWLEACT